MYCRLPQKIPKSKESEQSLIRQSSADDQADFAEYGLPKKTVSDVGTNFTFKHFWKQMNIQKTITSLYNHQSNKQVEVCIKFVKQTNKNALTLIETFP